MIDYTIRVSPGEKNKWHTEIFGSFRLIGFIENKESIEEVKKHIIKMIDDIVENRVYGLELKPISCKVWSDELLLDSEGKAQGRLPATNLEI